MSDKEEKSGFRIFTIDIDTLTGRVLSVTADTLRGFRPAAPRDEEGICYFPESGTLFISGEEDQQILEYDTLGQLTVRDAAGNTVAELPILAGEDVGHVTFVQMLGRCLARGFCMGSQS